MHSQFFETEHERPFWDLNIGRWFLCSSTSRLMLKAYPNMAIDLNGVPWTFGDHELVKPIESWGEIIDRSAPDYPPPTPKHLRS